MNIGIDIMGGDFAPDEVCQGVISAQKELKEDEILNLVGDEKYIKDYLVSKGENLDKYNIFPSTEVIGMGEHPAKAFSSKPNSSIAIGFKLLAKGEIDGFAGAGNTGAMLVGAMMSVKQIPGIIRPCLTTAIPKSNGKKSLLLDVGINPDCKPDVLNQYAILGSIYAKQLFNCENPKVGLLNIGSEEEKGNLLAKATYDLMKDTKDFNFIGNIEGHDLLKDKADVIVCDGFTGNIVLKYTEAFYAMLKKRNLTDEYIEEFNFENTGGAPVLGVNKPVIIAHGISQEKAIKNMILHTRDVIAAKLTEKIKEALL